MKTANQWLDEYSVTHQNKTNKHIHSCCVPLIFWSLIGMVWSFQVNLALLILVIVLVFYAKLGLKYFLWMSLMSAAGIFLAIVLIILQRPLLGISLTVFALAWVGQFYGHKIEGKKPAFFEDLQFLLIGPLWVLKNLGAL